MTTEKEVARMATMGNASDSRTAGEAAVPDASVSHDQVSNQPLRLWVMHCPFKKAGFPVLGSSGATIEPVVIMKMATWNRLVAHVPALQTMQFEVGALDG